MRSELGLFSRDPIPVTVAGTRFLLPWQPAAVWLQGLERLGVLAAVLADEDQRSEMADLVMSHPGARADLEAESLRILGEAGGRKWWEAGRLASTGAATEILGRLVLAGVDPWQRSIGEWCAAVFAVCMKGQDEKGRIKFEFTLSLPPPGYEEEWDDGMDQATVLALTGGQ
jgi:hypothetical protein